MGRMGISLGKSGFWTLSAALLAAGAGLAPQTAQAIPIEVAASPNSNLSLILAAVQSAQQSIQINVYEMTNADLVNALISKIQQGVTVQILEEGQPFGGVPQNEQPVTNQLVQAMQSASNSNNRFVEMSSQNNPSVQRRFVFDHAKYMIIDSQAAFVGSENYSASGQPRAGAKGTRGWEVFVHSPELASYFENIFNSDANPSSPDIQVLYGNNASLDLRGVRKGSGGVHKAPTAAAPAPAAPAPLPGSSDEYSSGDVSTVSPVVSPTTSQVGLVNLLNSATSSLDIEQYSFEQLWKTSRQNSPLFQAVVAAARRGVHVRVLLNDDRSNGGNLDEPVSSDNPWDNAFGGTAAKGPSMNSKTIDSLNQIASQEHLPLEARFANLNAMNVYYVHNKGVLVDSDKTLISSINWTENAVTNNREAALILTGAGVHNYYEALFDQDWNVSQ